jgi:hypothetical protein
MAGVHAAVRRVCYLGAFLALAIAAPVRAATPDYADASEEDLRALRASWDDLDGDERRALLTEIHRRMVAAGKKPVLRIRAERRFGYRVPQPDVSVVEIERRQEFVGYRELDPAQPFGVGFEERHRNQPVPVSDVAAADAPRPGSPEALARSAVEDGNNPVPRAGAVPVYQLPIRQVRAAESPR